MKDLDATDVARHLGLAPLGFEGGFYRETYRSPLDVSGEQIDARYSGRRSIGTAIFYMLTPESRSLMHRLQSDEVYHFYLGDPVDLLLIHPSGAHEEIRLGSDLLAGHRLQQVVPAGAWQGSRLVEGGRFALMGTTMGPGFDLEDFELGRRAELLEAYPHLAVALGALTPEVLSTDRLELAAATKDLLHAHLRGPEALCKGLAADATSVWPLPFVDEWSIRDTLRQLEREPQQRGWWGYYVLRSADRALIGWAGYEGPPNDRSEVAVRFGLSAEEDDSSLRAEIARALVARAFQHPGVAVILVRAAKDDLTTARAVEALGFEPDGEARWRLLKGASVQ